MFMATLCLGLQVALLHVSDVSSSTCLSEDQCPSNYFCHKPSHICCPCTSCSPTSRIAGLECAQDLRGCEGCLKGVPNGTNLTENHGKHEVNSTHVPDVNKTPIDEGFINTNYKYILGVGMIALVLSLASIFYCVWKIRSKPTSPVPEEHEHMPLRRVNGSANNANGTSGDVTRTKDKSVPQ